MKHLSSKAGLAALTLALGLANSALAQPIFSHELFKPNVNLDTGSQNTWSGTMGEAFATYTTGSVVTHLGYYDSQGDGLVNSHTVNLFLSTSSGGSGGPSSILASVVVPAGTAAPLVDGYRWVSLGTPLTLPGNAWYTLSAEVDGVDLFGDLISGTSVTMDDPYYSYNGWSSSYARYGNDPVSNEPNFGSYAQSVYPAGNLGFAIVPEPSSLAVGCAGFLAFLFRRSFRK